MTHCTYKKNSSLKRTTRKVPPEKLYTGKRIHWFIDRCEAKKVKWAIFSDLYGVWFPEEKHPYYEKHPNKVTDEEFSRLVNESARKLRRFDKVYFYGNHKSHYFHGLYKRLIRELIRRGINVAKICSIHNI